MNNLNTLKDQINKIATIPNDEMNKPTNFNANGQIIRDGKSVYSSIIINATPNNVWNILMNFDQYPAWNPFITSISGNPTIGSTIAATICPPGQKPMQFKPTVLQNQKNTEFRWKGTLGIPYIFDGEHVFQLQDNNNGTTTLHHFEYFRGVLVPLFKKMLEQNTQQGFEAMNLALKQQVESYIVAVK